MKWLKVGGESINLEAFKGWDYDKFSEFIKRTNLEKTTGLKIDALAKKVGIEVPKKDSDK